MAAVDKSKSVKYMLEPLKPFFEDSNVTEIVINKPCEVYTESKGKWIFHKVEELSFDYLSRLATAVATFAHTSIAPENPIMSAVLPNGERSQFVMPPACKDGTISVTIRKPSFSVRTLDQYLEDGFFAHVRPASKLTDADNELIQLRREMEAATDHQEQMKLRAKFLTRAVELGKNIIIAGETGSGKTTFMKTLMQSIPTDQRLITIEDVPELMWGLPNHNNVVNLLYPSEAGENSPITAASLMRSCLRMKPDRILLAELRGGETYDFLNVCLSGHSGTITSCHSGSSKGVFEYLALKVLQSPVGKNLPYKVIEKLLHMVVDVIVCVHNDKSGFGRHITELWYEPYSKFEGEKADV